VGVGYALALGSPSFRDFQVELVEAELKRNPNFDNPLMMLPLQRSVFAVWLKTVPYAIAGVVFTTGVAFLAFAREAYGILSLFMAAFFCGGCLLVGGPLFALSGRCLRWHFIPLGLGFFTIGVCLCLGGVSALTACFPFEQCRKLARRLFSGR
jgi:hypothetical protein